MPQIKIFGEVSPFPDYLIVSVDEAEVLKKFDDRFANTKRIWPHHWTEWSLSIRNETIHCTVGIPKSELCIRYVERTKDGKRIITVDKWISDSLTLFPTWLGGYPHVSRSRSDPIFLSWCFLIPDDDWCVEEIPKKIVNGVIIDSTWKL